MNIEGLSEATLEKFLNLGYLHSFQDIYHLEEHREDIVALDGYGEKSFEPNLYSLSFNHIDGEPSHPIQQEYTFHPAPYQRSSYEFEYRMLSKLQSDCEYYLGYGNRSPSILCNHSVQNHIARMKELWNGFPTDQKPEWLTWEQLLQYEKVMTETGIPVKNCSD